MEKINAVCLFHGTAYDIEYVINLERALRRYLAIPYQFNILTNRRDLHDTLTKLGNVIYLPDVTYKRAWWHKLYMFAPQSGLRGVCLYFDLDVIIQGALDVFVSKDGRLHIIHDFNRANTTINQSNSSIMSWTHENYQYLWQQFSQDTVQYCNSMHGDQDFIHKFARDRVWYDDKLTSSYRWEYLRGKNYGPETRAIILHGKPKPHELTDAALLAQWRQVT